MSVYIWKQTKIIYFIKLSKLFIKCKKTGKLRVKHETIKTKHKSDIKKLFYNIDNYCFFIPTSFSESYIIGKTKLNFFIIFTMTQQTIIWERRKGDFGLFKNEFR